MPNLAFADIATDKSVYSKGESVNIFGTINLRDDQTVNIIKIEIIDLNNDDKIVDTYAPIDDNGAFSISYDSSAWSIGEYRVTVSDDGIEETTEFELSESSTSNDSNHDVADNNAQQQESSLTSHPNTVPNSPIDLTANVISSKQIDLFWNAPYGNDVSITGYKIEVKVNTDSTYSTVVTNTDNTDTTYSHTDLVSGTVYAYRVSTINSIGESVPSTSVTVKTSSDDDSRSVDLPDLDLENTEIPTDVVAKALSPTSVELSWNSPVQTYGQAIHGYTIKQELAPNVYSEIASTSGSTTKYIISNLNTDETYTFAVVANYALSSSDISKKAIVTLTSSSGSDDENSGIQQENESISAQDGGNFDDSNSLPSTTVPSPPLGLKSISTSQSRILLSWLTPIDSDISSLIGYKIEYKTSDESDYSILVPNNGSPSTLTYAHTGLTVGLTYQYRVYAINSDGESLPSEVFEATIMSDNDGQIESQQSSPLQPSTITLKTDKTVYALDDPIEISGIIDGDLTQNIPLGVKITSSDDVTVYAKNIPVDNIDKTFGIVIATTQRQSETWQSGGEFTIEVTYNGFVKATTTFENNAGTEENFVSSDPSENKPSVQSPPLDDSSDTVQNNELDTIKSEYVALQSANQQLQDENKRLQIQIKDLDQRIEQLNALVMEQVRVMMEHFNTSND